MALDATPARDPRLVGRYRLLQKLGEGGMGVVHLGLDPDGRAVAVKVLRPHIAADPDARRRLAREVSTLRRVRHPRVAAVIDADTEGEVPFLVTHFVPGKPLDTHVRDHGPLPRGHVARVGAVLADALRAIHNAGVIHRDVKPANVMLLDGEPILIDFGIAHIADESRITHTGLVMGTPGYLSPEIIGGDAVSTATDWWGWGATLAFAATGRPPFGSGPVEVVLDRVRRGVTDIEGIDAGLQATLTAALAVDPSRRPTPERLIAGLAASAPSKPLRVYPARDDSAEIHTWEGPTVRRAPTPNTGVPAGHPAAAETAVAAGAAVAGAAVAGAAAATVVGPGAVAPVAAAAAAGAAAAGAVGAAAVKAAGLGHHGSNEGPTRPREPARDPARKPVDLGSVEAFVNARTEQYQPAARTEQYQPNAPTERYAAAPAFNEAPTTRHEPVAYEPTRRQDPPPRPPQAAAPAAPQTASPAGPGAPTAVVPPAPLNGFDASTGTYGPSGAPRPGPWWAPAQVPAPAEVPAPPYPSGAETPPNGVGTATRPPQRTGRSPWYDALRPAEPPQAPAPAPDTLPSADEQRPEGPPPEPSRGVLIGLLITLSAVAAVAPYGAIRIAALGMIVARVVDRTNTALLVKRDLRGNRGSDPVMTTLALPWRVVKAVVLTFFFLILPVLVGISVAFIIASALAGAPARAIPGEPIPLAAGMAALLLTAWWGPGGGPVRHGSARAAKFVVRGPRARIVVWALVALIAVSVLVVLNNGTGPDWGPWEGSRVVQYLTTS